MRKFENFVNDDTRDAASLDLLPKHNPARDLAAKNYVEDMIKSNDLNLLFRAAGVKPPKNLSSVDMDEKFDEIKQKAIDYYIENPHDMGKDIPVRKIQKRGDGAPRTNNVGGALHPNSPRVGENKINFDAEFKIKPLEMELFNSEESLVELIRNNKIMLGNCIVHFNSRDKETKQKLDIYFEIDDVEPIEENFDEFTEPIMDTDTLIYVGELGSNFNLSNFGNIQSLIDIKNTYTEAFHFDSIDEKTKQNLINAAQSVFKNYGIRIGRKIGDIAEQTAEALDITNGRFEILSIELMNQDYKIVIDVAKSVAHYVMVFIKSIEKVERDSRGNIGISLDLNIEELMTDSTYICNIDHNFESWKELLSNIFEKL